MKTKFNDKQLALFAIIGAIILGGGLSPLTKVALKSIPLAEYNFLRFFIAAISILPFFLRTKFKPNKHFYKVLLFSLFLTGNVFLAPIGISLTTATIAQTLYIFVPILVALLSYFFAVEIFTIRKIYGLLLGLLGALIIIVLPIIESFSPFAGNFQGNLIIFIAVILTAFYTVLSKRFQKTYSPLQLTSLFIFVTFIFTIPFALNDFIYHPLWWHNLTPLSVSAMLYLGVLGTTIYYLLTQYAIKHGSPLIAAMLLYLQPAATFIWAFLLLGEQLTTGFLIGTALAFIGVYLTLQSPKK